jgi:hypothetical protein
MSGAPKPRRTAILAKSLDKQLNRYTLAARANCLLTYAAAVGAAGVSVMSLAPLAEARIIYTPTNVNIPVPSRSGYTLTWIDFENLGKAGAPHTSRDADFEIVREAGCKSTFVCVSGMFAGGYGNKSNSIAATANGYAVALGRGARMGPHRHVEGRGEMAAVWHSNARHTTLWDGQWANGGKGLKNGYLGLKFTLNGDVHYGWARVSLTVKNNRFNTATLTGYAFETIPNKSIIIGKTQGPDVIVEPATLGHLAAGTKARSAWRKRGAVPDAQTDVSPDGR